MSRDSPGRYATSLDGEMIGAVPSDHWIKYASKKSLLRIKSLRGELK